MPLQDFFDHLRARTREKPYLRWLIYLLPVLSIVAALTEPSSVWRIIFVVLTVIYGLVAWQMFRTR